MRNNDSQTSQHFAAYFTRFLVWRLGSRHGDLDLIDDVRQETLRRVLEATRKGSLREARCLESFVNSVCNHVLLEHWRSSKKHAHLDKDVETILSQSNPERTYRRV